MQQVFYIRVLKKLGTFGLRFFLCSVTSPASGPDEVFGACKKSTRHFTRFILRAIVYPAIKRFDLL